MLFVNAFTTHFTNFHNSENVRYGQDYAPGAAQLLQYLISQAFIPEYQVRFRWKPNSVAMWDNRSTQHYAVMDYPPCHRKMERAGIMPAFGLIAIFALLMASRTYVSDIEQAHSLPADETTGGAPRPALA